MKFKELKEIEGAIEEYTDVIAYMKESHKRSHIKNDMVALACMKLVKEILIGEKERGWNKTLYDSITNRYQQIRRGKG